MSLRERVSVVKCASTADDDTVVRCTQEAIEALGDYGRGLRNARKIAVKINAGVHRLTLTDGKQTELTEPAVVEGALRAIRNVTDAEIILGDGTTDGDSEGLYRKLGYPERIARYSNVRLVDFNQGERAEVAMTHPDPMFRSYWLPRELAESDAFVSLAKMKAHVGMGCTLSIKNLFGWMPTDIYGTPRLYLHDRLIRLPRVLADIAAWMRPCLNVVDGIVAASKSEWGGTPMRPGVILAGTNCVATDSVGARVMGFDPEGDYPDHPFFYRRNAIKLAAQQGVGPNRADEIEILGPQIEAVSLPFHVDPYHGDTHRDEQQRKLSDRYRGRYLALTDGEVLWDGDSVATMHQLERESGRSWQDAPQFIVRCLPPDEEIERMDWYRVEAGKVSVER
jgi:uncharacterized protein (DUF362 family)